jgi:RNA:NAD 2'-phosphotransferase (TPT1/KptA family)
MKTSTYKCTIRSSWVSETDIPLTENTKIVVRTSKTHSGALVTQATRYKIDGDMMSYEPFSDFSKRYSITQNRCTQKNILTQHESVLANIDQIKADCARVYGN